MTHRWVVPPPQTETVAALASALGIGLPAAKVLVRRGYNTPDSARRFLDPSLDELHDPLLMRDMPEALARLRQAIEGGEKILIYGDYDVDGTTSVVILKKAIELAGGAADYHVPHRLKDGYGMRPEVVEAAAGAGVKLIVSVDTGIRAAEVVGRANELGIDVIVTDHHLPESEPAARARGAQSEPSRLPVSREEPVRRGCGLQAGRRRCSAPWGGRRKSCGASTESFLKMVAIATVADVVPLTGENRVIVKHGLSGLRSVRNPGLRALLDVAGFTGDTVPTSRQVAFQIAPRLNAAGRMDTAKAVIELFLTSDPERARALAQQLHEQNAERQQVEAETREMCERIEVDPAAAGLVYYAEDWHRGVLGIVASRLVERLHRPVFVLSRNPEDGMVQGSGRSIPAFHLLEALESMPDLFARFGGHEHAAGVTLEESRVEEFRERFNACAASRLTAEDFLPEIAIDGVVDAARNRRAQRGGRVRAGAVRPRQPAAAVCRAGTWKWRGRRWCGTTSTSR